MALANSKRNGACKERKLCPWPTCLKRPSGIESGTARTPTRSVSLRQRGRRRPASCRQSVRLDGPAEHRSSTRKKTDVWRHHRQEGQKRSLAAWRHGPILFGLRQTRFAAYVAKRKTAEKARDQARL